MKIQTVGELIEALQREDLSSPVIARGSQRGSFQPYIEVRGGRHKSTEGKVLIEGVY